MALSPSVPYKPFLYQQLKDLDQAAAYLEVNLDELDKKFFLIALRDVVDANGGILALSRKTRLSRPNLYRILSENGNPEIMTLNKVLRAIGLSLSVKPLAVKRRGARQKA